MLKRRWEWEEEQAGTSRAQVQSKEPSGRPKPIASWGQLPSLCVHLPFTSLGITIHCPSRRVTWAPVGFVALGGYSVVWEPAESLVFRTGLTIE